MEKQKRIKRVFSNYMEVLHRWANQTQDSARCKNVFFEGKRCYSYGHHYELGRLVEYNGLTVALINAQGYSHTTAKHIHGAAASTSHIPTVLVNKGVSRRRGDWHNSDAEYYNLDTKRGIEEAIRSGLINNQDRLIEQLFSIFNARSGYYFSSFAASYVSKEIKDFNNLCLTLGLTEYTLDIIPEFVELYNAKLSELNAKQAVKNAEREAKRELERIERAKLAQENLAAWLNGGAYSYQLNNIVPQRLRIKADKVETTGGASVPVSHAIRLLKLIESGKVRKGECIGEYQLDSVSKGIVKIGCHTISLAEAKSVLGNIQPKLQLAVSNE